MVFGCLRLPFRLRRTRLGIFAILQLVRPISVCRLRLLIIPFSATAADGAKMGDPRKAIAERYVSRDDYLVRYTKAVEELVRQRWILPEDRESLLHRGEEEWTEATKELRATGVSATGN